jgi:uncharacterized protein (TIGR03083 family)
MGHYRGSMAAVAAPYAEVRARLFEIADSLDGARAESPVPTCPEWTVRQVYAHLSGVVADVLVLNVEGAATDPWTAEQVAARNTMSFADIVAEWRESSAAFDAALESLGEHGDVRLVADVWTHEQDVRTALDQPGGRDGIAFEFVRDALAAMLGNQLDARGLGAIRWIDENGRERVLGTNPVGVTLHTSEYAFCRARLGRRSRDQIRNLGWDVDAEPWLDAFIVFGPASQAIDEAG